MVDKINQKSPDLEPDFYISWHDLDLDDVLVKLETHPQGLSKNEVARRLDRYGPNELKEKPRPTFLQLLLEQLNNFIVILLIVASVVSAILGDWIEAGVIMLIVVLNAALGVVQESKAEESLAALKKMAAPECQVLRDGQRVSVPARGLVPGDMVFLEAGNFVPADMRLIEAVNLRVEEAALTGESVPVQKNASIVLEKDASLGDRKNTVFMGTLVNYGRGQGVVVSTAMHTQLGLIAEMLQAVDEEQTPLQTRLDQLGKTLGIAALFICGVVFLLGLIRSDVFTMGISSEASKIIIESFMIAVGLAIAAVPEGLSAVVTISLALGMREMVRRHALIRKLPAVETLGSVTVICSDKTGTLTENRMTVTILDFADNKLDLTEEEHQDIQTRVSEIHYVEEPTEQQTALLRQHPSLVLLLSGGAMCNDALIEADKESPNRFVMIGDPTEGALVVAATRMGLPKSLLDKAFPRVAEVPFESDRKRMTTIHRFPQTMDEVEPPLRPIWDWETHIGTTPYMTFTKGSVDGLLSISKQVWADNRIEPLDDSWRKRIEEANAHLAEEGVRVLGVATRTLDKLPEDVEAKDVEKDLIFVGLVGMIDPARPEVKDAVNTCRKAGIRPIMITGDHPLTARYIATELGIAEQGEVITGAQLEKMEDTDLEEAVKRVSVFARVSPEHKLRIVSALQNNGHIAAMTGDGVNDAPALKKADIGVAMGITGTDVAKGTADMVLTDDNYASIVAAVEQGRVIYSNIRKFVFFLLSSNLAEVMIIFLATLAGLPMPLTVIQLLWLNLITDGAPALALAMEKGDPDVMDRPPRPKDESIINSSMRLGMTIQTIAQTAVVLGAFMLGLYWHLDTQVPAGENPFLYLLRYNWRGIDVQIAETMAFVTLSLCELFRAFTVRSEHASILRIGIFSNKYMLYAVGLSAGLLLLVVNLPFLQPIFNTHFLAAREWLIVIGLAFIPAIAEEITKVYLRAQDKKAASA